MEPIIKKPIRTYRVKSVDLSSPKDLYVFKHQQTLNQINKETCHQHYHLHHEAKMLIEVIKDVPVYIKIPIKNYIAPCYLCFSYIRSDGTTLLPPK
jgi:hypothetical protein